MSSTPPEEQFSDSLLRPATFAEYVGQEQIKKSLSILIGAAKTRGQAPEHVLFYGPPGLGKTTLAHVIAKEMDAQVRLTSGPAIERVGDLAAILTNLQPGDMLFIDEIHRLNKSIEEVLYPVMETGKMDIMIGKGPSARTVQLDLPPFTLVGATTRFGMLSAPLRSRFSGGTYRLEFYTDEEIARILRRSAQLLDISLPDNTDTAIAARSRQTPRIANYLLRRVRDYAQMHDRALDQESITQAFDLLGLDDNGLSAHDINLLKTIRDKFSGGPVGVKNLAAATGEDDGTIEDVTEPYLIQLGLLERTPRGRALTEKGKLYIRDLSDQDIILAVDPGFDRCGAAIVQTGHPSTVVHSWCIQTNKKDSHAERLAQVYKSIETAILEYHPIAIAVETLFFSVNKKSALAVAEARGVIVVSAGLHQIPLLELSPQEVKLAMTGSGNADKLSVQKMVRLTMKIDIANKIDDEIDAIALGMAAAGTLRLKHFVQ